MSDDEFDIRVYDESFTRKGWIGDPLYVTATPRHNLQPTATCALSGTDSKLNMLAASGARVVIRYRDEQILSGPVRARRAEGPLATRIVTFEIEDDWRLLRRILGWPVPAAALDAQTSKWGIYSGPAETVVKDIVGAAVDRLGLPVTMAPDLGRGDDIWVRTRFYNLADVLYPQVDQAGIGITVRQSGGGLVLDCYEPTDWPIALSEDGGTIAEGSWSLTPPEVTRVVGGFDGKGTARIFDSLVNTVPEATWGDVVETFVDARDLDHTDPDFAAESYARMHAALADGAVRSGLSLTLAETDTFTYGGPNGVHVGDRVTVELAPGVTTTDVLREATLTWSKSGMQVTPVVGERTNDSSKTNARAMASLARAHRIQQTRE